MTKRKKRARHADANLEDMSWADVSAALSAGARPQDVVTGVRQLFTSATNNNDSALSPPPSPPPPSNNDVSALYRKPLLTGTSAVQLCYLRAPLHVLEQLDKNGGDVSDEEDSGQFRFDSEFSFDILSHFKPRLIAPIAHESLSLPRISTSDADINVDVDGDSTLLDVEEGSTTDLKALGRSLARGSGRAVVRSRRLNYADWAQAYPIYTAYTTISSPADAAVALVRDTSSAALCSYILKEIAPKLPPDTIAGVVTACNRALAGSSTTIKTNDIAATIEALQKSNPTSALDVLESVVR